MTRRSTLAAATLAATALVLAACGGGDEDDAGGNGGDGGDGGEDQLAVINVVNGPLGDQSFFDDAERGMVQMAEDGIRTSTVQADAENPAQWRSNLETASGEDWDYIIVGTTQMNDILTEVSQSYPDQMYIIYDDVVEQDNVASIVYRQNEGSFVAGVLAALVTENPDDFEHSTGSGVIGLVGGMDIPVINDFVVGFEAGAAAVNPDIEVLVSYVGDFVDSARGYDHAAAMYEQGADVVFQVAGGAGAGVLQAAAAEGRYAIGVDSNQNGIEEGYILASMLKNIGASLVLAVEQAESGELTFGETTAYGLENGGVGLTYEDNGDAVPQEYIDEVETYIQQVIDGEIDVPTTL